MSSLLPSYAGDECPRFKAGEQGIRICRKEPGKGAIIIHESTVFPGMRYYIGFAVGGERPLMCIITIIIKESLNCIRSSRNSFISWLQDLRISKIPCCEYFSLTRTRPDRNQSLF